MISEEKQEMEETDHILADLLSDKLFRDETVARRVRYYRRAMYAILFSHMAWTFLLQFASGKVWASMISTVVFLGVFCALFRLNLFFATVESMERDDMFLSVFLNVSQLLAVYELVQRNNDALAVFYNISCFGIGIAVLQTPRAALRFMALSTLMTASCSIVLLPFEKGCLMAAICAAIHIGTGVPVYAGLRKRASQELEALDVRNKLHQSIAEGRLERLKAEASSQVKSSFLSNMSHEIRTPLNGLFCLYSIPCVEMFTGDPIIDNLANAGLIGMTSLCLRTVLSDEQREYLEAVQFSGDALLTLISDIIDIGRIESGQIVMRNAPFLLRKTLIESMRAVAYRAEAAKNIAIICAVDETIPDNLEGDSHRLRQIVINLVGNAYVFRFTLGLFR
jgi:signal transduction histidine kinase